MPSELNVKSQQNILYNSVVSLFLDLEEQISLQIVCVF